EVPGARRLEQLVRQTSRSASIAGERQRVVDEIAGLASPKLNLSRPVVFRQHLLDQRSIELDVHVPTVVLEDLDEVRNRRALREDFVLNAAQEGLVHQLLRLDVRCKYDHRREWELELLASQQRHEVHAAFERDDPTVQQIARRTVLTPEVVDDQ